MANVIYNDRESNSTEWTIVVKGIKYLTLEYKPHGRANAT